MNRIFIRKHITSFSIAIFVLIFIIIQYIKPAFLYNSDGSIRHFGLGYRRKTIFCTHLTGSVINSGICLGDALEP